MFVASFVAIALGGALASGCAHPQAKTIASVPEVPLDVPAPPPRAVEPITADALPVLGPVGEPAGTARPPQQGRPSPPAQPAPRSDAPRADAPRVETPPADNTPKPADDATARPPAPAPNAPTLQTIPPQNEGQVEAQVRAQLSRASADLNRVDYGKLSQNARTQYDQAKRFVAQSEEQIRSRNLILAQTLADKAAEIASQLGR